MPELPEVELLKRQLARAVVGKRVKSVIVKVNSLFGGEQNDLFRATITRVSRRHKLLILSLSNGKVLIIHLKMTGQLVFARAGQGRANSTQIIEQGFVGGHPDRAYTDRPPHKYTHIILEFSDRSKLYYNDLRKFGWWRVIDGRKTKSQSGQSALEQVINQFAPEPLGKDFTLDHFKRALKRKAKSTIKQALMDEQKVVAGVGNIYSDETLFCARVNPRRRCRDLSERKIAAIFRCIPKVLKESIVAGGTSFSNFIHLQGQKGDFYQQARVYGKAGKNCRRKDGGLIERVTIGNRSSHFCPICQK